MRAQIMIVAGLLGCGGVERSSTDARVADAAPDGAMTCVVHDEVASCGPTCAVCPAGGEREVASCDGTACALGCRDGAPRCTDQSCARLAWTFASNGLDGIAARDPEGLALAVRNRGGNLAMAIDVTDLREVSFRVPICVSGTVQLQSLTLSATVYFDGPPGGGKQYYVQASVPEPRTGAYLGTVEAAAGEATAYVSPLSFSELSNNATDVVFRVGTLGAAYSGTIWFDDIQIQ